MGIRSYCAARFFGRLFGFGTEAPEFELAAESDGSSLYSVALNFSHILWISVRAIVIASN